MALSTRAQFFFGGEILFDEVFIDFSEGGPTLTAELRPDYYSLSDLCEEIARAMSQAGTQTYSVEIDRTTRQINIQAASDFDLLILSGPNADASPWSKLGFATGADLTGTNQYTGANAAGYQYRPLFYLLDYIDPENQKRAVESVTAVSATGRIEVVQFGRIKFMECTIDLINDYRRDSSSELESSPTNVADTRFFMDELIKKGTIEFMPDRDDPDTFYRCILESTPIDGKGLGYALQPRDTEYGDGFFSTGRLTFRIVEAA